MLSMATLPITKLAANGAVLAAAPGATFINLGTDQVATFANSGRVIVTAVLTTTAINATVTLSTIGAPDSSRGGVADANETVTMAATGTNILVLGPFRSDLFNSSTGNVTMTFAPGASFTNSATAHSFNAWEFNLS